MLELVEVELREFLWEVAVDPREKLSAVNAALFDKCTSS